MEEEKSKIDQNDEGHRTGQDQSLKMVCIEMMYAQGLHAHAINRNFTPTQSSSRHVEESVATAVA
jgi:hypothetical protein